MSALGKKVHHSELDPQNTRFTFPYYTDQEHFASQVAGYWTTLTAGHGLTLGNPLAATQAEDPTDSTQALKDFIEANYPAAYEQALDRLIREGHQP